MNFGEGGSVKAKKAISLLSILTVVGLLVAGCGSSGLTDTSGEVASAPSEAQSAATGDIPDNQTFLVFHDPQAGYSIRYPEGWARKGSANDVTFKEKANVVHVVVRKGSAKGTPKTKTTYSRLSAPDPVTGKRLHLMIDRYEYPQGGKVAVVDLVTPVGVDNVDAYRLISESFQWQK
ncbi:MAG TPA: PsbP-related protein [Solirubrobacterales bacterium]|nr:PsbP-related protein [Solirubrobacterales bacterium]